MIPLGVIAKVLEFTPDDLPAEQRAQRQLNKARIPQIARYVLENPKNYVLSSLTASIDRAVRFEASEDKGLGSQIGVLSFPVEAEVLINDGQHRRAAIEKAIKEMPHLSRESISVVIFVDKGLNSSQQMFSDLNKYSVKPSSSLNVLYDHRNPLALLVKEIVDEVSVFGDMVELAKTSISNRSRKLFTLNSIYSATKELINKKDHDQVSNIDCELAKDFWIEVSKNMPDWKAAVNGDVSAANLRNEYVHAHGVALHAIALAGKCLINEKPKSWRNSLTKLAKINWERNNAELWEGRAMIGGRLSKAKNNVVLTSNAIKHAIGLKLSESDRKVEAKYEQGR